MKISPIVLLTVFLSGLGTIPLNAQTATSAAASYPPSFEEALKQGNFAQLEKDLLAQIKKDSEGKSLEAIRKDASLVKRMTALQIIQSTGAEHLSKLVAKDKKYAAFLKYFLNDLAWMEMYLRSGVVPKDTDIGMRVLGDIWTLDGRSPDFKTYMPMATALASVWGGEPLRQNMLNGEDIKAGNGRKDPLWRYQFFKKSHKNNVLYPGFEKLEPWELRFVVGGNWDDASLEYTQKEINLPPNQYESACWSAPYIGTSEFGDTVQGPLYGIAWDDNMGNAERTRAHGGVCGALSTVGATASAARGIPAYTVGQPGHCAYGYRLERGKWSGGFGGPDGGPHNFIFPGTAPANFDAMEVAFASNDKVKEAFQNATVAGALSSAGVTATAKEAWAAALKATPANIFLQKDFQKFALDNKLYSPEQWQQYAMGVLGVLKGNGYAALDIVKGIESEFLAGMNDDQKIEWMALQNQSLALSRSSWALDISKALLEEQENKLGPAGREKLLAEVLQIHMNVGDGTNFGKALEWAVTSFVDKGKVDMFSRAFEQAASQPSLKREGANEKETEEMDKKMREAYGKAIVKAEEARSPAAVKAITAASTAYQTPAEGPSEQELDCPEGNLVSDGGYLRLSTTSGWDRPCDHLSVLTKKGGFFHTSAEEAPHVIVELPKTAKLSGLLIVKNKGSEQRVKKVKVSRSVDGATWFDLADTDDMKDQWKIDLPKGEEARWIKVESLIPDGNKEVFHLRNILIFEKNN